MRDFSTMPEAMRPQAVPGLPGVSTYASFSAVKNVEAAVGAPASEILRRLLEFDLSVIEETAARCLINADGSTWSAGVDALPVDVFELGKLLADALHRRLFGRPLELESD